MRSIKNYPLTDSGDYEPIIHPVQITEEIIAKHQPGVLVELIIGKWICVEVLLPEGFRVKPNVMVIDTEEYAKKACSVHNSWAGYTPLQVDKIISKSMGLPVPTRKATA